MYSVHTLSDIMNWKFELEKIFSLKITGINKTKART